MLVFFSHFTFFFFFLLSTILGLAISSQDATGFDLSEPRAMASCGTATISRGEFALCDASEPVFLSVWNLEDKHRAIELTFSYSRF